MTWRAPTYAVLGFRPHTYWTAVVAVAGDPLAPDVLRRRRVTFAAGDTRSVYHRVESMSRVEAEAWVSRVRATTVAEASAGVGALLEDLRAAGTAARAAAVPIGRARVPDKLEDIVKSHSHMHAAEGDFYRGVVAEACLGLGLEVGRVVEKDLPGRVCARLGAAPHELEARLKLIGAALGPPWTEDEKLATLAAWTLLEDRGTAPDGHAP